MRTQTGLRTLNFVRDFIPTAPGSVLVEFGATRVICTVMISEGVPGFLDPTTQSWLTAEYAMLPASTLTRKSRERDKVDSRSLEIQRLVGRSLRQAVDLSSFAGMTLAIDCDVIQADGGTRTASITGAWVALVDALRWLNREERLFRNPLLHQIAAVSVGVVDDVVQVDLDYFLDSKAQVDLNLVVDESGSIIEIQGTGEKRGATRAELTEMLDKGQPAIAEIMKAQLAVLGVSELSQIRGEFD
ncbi:MAG: ribonuclease PH [Planctomycetota bacterium]